MKRSLSGLAALGLLAGIVGPVVTPAVQSGQQVANATTSASPAHSLSSVIGAAAWHRLNSGGWRRGARSPRGKRYSASIRQHQRHAAKARRVKAHRARRA
jgi:hypothetical protein